MVELVIGHEAGEGIDVRRGFAGKTHDERGAECHARHPFPNSVQQTVVALMPKDSSLLALTATSLAVVLPLAWLSWRWVEKPALARKPAQRGDPREDKLIDLPTIQDSDPGELATNQPNQGL
jgi:hypothetical protein